MKSIDEEACSKDFYIVKPNSLKGFQEKGNLNKICTQKGDLIRYIWRLRKGSLVFCSDRPLVSQKAFRVECIRQLKFLPEKLKQEDWCAEVNLAVSTMTVTYETDA